MHARAGSGLRATLIVVAAHPNGQRPAARPGVRHAERLRTAAGSLRDVAPEPRDARARAEPPAPERSARIRGARGAEDVADLVHPAVAALVAVGPDPGDEQTAGVA